MRKRIVPVLLGLFGVLVLVACTEQLPQGETPVSTGEAPVVIATPTLPRVPASQTGIPTPDPTNQAGLTVDIGTIMGMPPMVLEGLKPIAERVFFPGHSYIVEYLMPASSGVPPLQVKYEVTSGETGAILCQVAADGTIVPLLHIKEYHQDGFVADVYSTSVYTVDQNGEPVPITEPVQIQIGPEEQQP